MHSCVPRLPCWVVVAVSVAPLMLVVDTNEWNEVSIWTQQKRGKLLVLVSFPKSWPLAFDGVLASTVALAVLDCVRLILAKRKSAVDKVDGRLPRVAELRARCGGESSLRALLAWDA